MVFVESAPRARRRRDLDSENGCEKWYFERPQPRLVMKALFGGRTSELRARDQYRVSRLWSGHDAPSLLSEEGNVAERHAVATIAGSHARRRILVAAPARGGCLRITPRSAQQRGARACGNCQRDRKDHCSEHRLLSSCNTQGMRQIQELRIASNLRKNAEIAHVPRFLPTIHHLSR